MDVDSKIAETIPQIDVDTAEEQYQNVENEDGIVLKRFIKMWKQREYHVTLIHS